MSVIGPFLLCVTVAQAGGAVRGSELPTATSITISDPNARQQEVTWNSGWRRFDWIEYSATVGVGVAFLAVDRYADHVFIVDLGAGNAFDSAIHDGVVVADPRARERIATASDWMQAFGQVQPFLIDGLAVSLGVHRDVDVAWQMTAMNLQAFAVSTLVSRGAHVLIERARPLNEECKTDPNFSSQCGTPGGQASFPSGHVTVAATGAGLACAHHAYLPLYGGGMADDVACYGMITVAGATAITRMLLAKHYLTDVIVGELVGFATGFGLPYLLHYGWSRDDDSAVTTTLVPMTLDGGGGFSLVGRF